MRELIPYFWLGGAIATFTARAMWRDLSSPRWIGVPVLIVLTLFAWPIPFAAMVYQADASTD